MKNNKAAKVAEALDKYREAVAEARVAMAKERAAWYELKEGGGEGVCGVGGCGGCGKSRREKIT